MYIWDKNEFGIASFYIQYRLGDFGRTIGSRGIPHLMEHLMCKTFDNLRNDLKRDGIEWNASTSSTQVLFYANGLSDLLEPYIQELYNRITGGATWTEDEFIAERSTVIQEYKDAFNDQENGAFRNSFRKHFNDVTAIGMLSDIENFSYLDSVSFANFFRWPSKLVQSGMTSQVQVNNESWPDGAYRPDKTPVHKFYENSGLELEKIPVEDKTNVALIGNVIFTPEQGKLADVASTCLGAGLESPLFQEVREKRGLVYGITHSCIMDNRSGFMYTAGCTTNDKADELKAVLTEFFSGDVSRHITRERFDICMAELRVSIRKEEILPFRAVKLRYINDVYGGDSLNVTFEEMMEFTKEYINMDHFVWDIN